MRDMQRLLMPLCTLLLVILAAAIFVRAGRDHFAAYDGTAPIEVSSGAGSYRLSRRGNCRLTMPSTWPRSPRSPTAQPGPGLLRQKAGRGQDPEEALRCLKRQISDAIFACLQADARRAATAKSPRGQPGNHSASRAAGLRPRHRLFGQATPGPARHPTTATAAFPAPPPSRASGRPGQGPGEARPRSGAHRASSTRPPASR